MEKFKLDTLSLQDLRVFLEVAEQRNLSQAAETLGLSQPSASYALQKLRKAYDDPLLVRIGREMELTPLGETILGFWRPVLDQAQNLTGDSFDPETTTRIFSIIGFVHDLRNRHGSFVDYLLEHAPNAGINMQGMYLAAVDEALQRNVDLYVGPNQAERTGYNGESIGRFDVQLYYDASVRPAPTTLEELSKREFLGIFEQFPELGSTDRALIAEGFKRRRFRFGLSTYTEIAERIKGSDLMASGSKILEWTPLGELDKAPVPGSARPIEHSMRWSFRKDRDPGVIWLRQLVQSYFAEVPRSKEG